MSSSTTKKVYVRRFDGPVLEGYVNPQTYRRPEGIEVLDRAAQVVTLAEASVKGVYFVRDFDPDGESKQKTAFASRPKQDGLWVRLNFRDGDTLEGVVANDMLLMEPAGLTITPPDPNAHAQRVFVPRVALREVTVLGVVGSPVRTRRRPKTPSEDQMDLFQRGGAESGTPGTESIAVKP